MVLESGRHNQTVMIDKLERRVKISMVRLSRP